MTLNEIAYNILNLVRGGRSNQSEHISLDQIKWNILHYRAMMIRRDYARNGLITRHLEQDLGCLELEYVDASKCCDLPSTCKVARTIRPIPKTVRFNFKDAITFIGDISGQNNIPIVSSNVVRWLPYDKYTKNAFKAYMIEDHIYIYNADTLKFINVRGVFENPADLTQYDCDDNSCYDENGPFPMPMDMVQAITMGMASGELQLLLNTTPDSLADQAQDPIGSAPKAKAPQQQGQGQG